MEHHFKNYHVNHKFQQKSEGILLKIEKEEAKKQNSSNITWEDWSESSVQLE